MEKILLKLIDSAIKAKEFSYSPYSKFRVGAALLSGSGKIYKGANVESASYSLTLCAERTAYVKAVTEGEKEFKAIAIASDGYETTPYPCGACRQFMYEFSPDLTVIVIKNNGTYETYKLSELLPHNFKLK